MTGETRGDQPRSRAGWVLVGLFVVSTALGVLAYWRYTVSERHLHAAFTELHELGKGLDAEGCVEAVLSWHKRCEAMESLCDHAIPMAMEHCLASRDRTPDCTGVHVEGGALGKWTYQQCKTRGISPIDGSRRREVRACAAAFTAFESFCHHDQKGVVL